MFTITLRWWMLWSLVSFLAPFIYLFFRKSGDDDDPGTDVIVWFGIFWGASLGIIIGHWL